MGRPALPVDRVPSGLRSIRRRADWSELTRQFHGPSHRPPPGSLTCVNGATAPVETEEQRAQDRHSTHVMPEIQVQHGNLDRSNGRVSTDDLERAGSCGVLMDQPDPSAPADCAPLAGSSAFPGLARCCSGVVTCVELTGSRRLLDSAKSTWGDGDRLTGPAARPGHRRPRASLISNPATGAALRRSVAPCACGLTVEMSSARRWRRRTSAEPHHGAPRRASNRPSPLPTM